MSRRSIASEYHPSIVPADPPSPPWAEFGDEYDLYDDPWHYPLHRPAGETEEEGDAHSNAPAELEDDGDVDPLLRQPPHIRFMRPMGANPVPLLAPHLIPAVESLADELIRETSGRDRFAMATQMGLYAAAETLARYRLTSLAALRQTDRDARRMFLADLRGLERRAFPDMQPPTARLSHFTPHLVKPRSNANGPPFA